MRSAVVVATLVGSLVAPVVIAQTPAPSPQPPEISVTGSVQHPGSFPWTADLTVGQAIALAGGTTERAILIARQEGTRMTKRTVLRTALLQPTDRVEVSARTTDAAGPRVIVLGAVRSPGTYTLASSRGAIGAAIAAAGGLLPTAGRDVQVWNRIGGRGGPPIDAATTAAEVVISHYSLLAPGAIGAGLSWDDQAVYVPARPEPATAAGHVTVMGEVAKPGDVTLPPDRLTVAGALTAAGGGLPSAGPFVVIRRSGVTPDPHRPRGQEFAPVASVSDGTLDFALRDGDTIDVQRSTHVSIERLTVLPGGASERQLTYGVNNWSPA